MSQTMEKPASIFDQVKDLRDQPKAAVDPEEQRIRSLEIEEEKKLRETLDAATAAREAAEKDLAALEEKSRRAGATSYMSNLGLASTPANQETQKQARSFLPLAESQVNETREAERAARVHLQSACTARSTRRQRLAMLAEREADKMRGVEKAARIQELRAARIAEMKAFLKA